MLYEKNADREGHLYFELYEGEKCRQKERPIPHFHNSMEIVFVRYGEVSVYINGEEYTLFEGDLAFVDKLTPHTSGYAIENPKTVYYVIVASAAYLSCVDWLREYTLPPVIRKNERCEKLLSLIEWAYEVERVMSKEMKIGFVALLFGFLREYHGSLIKRSEKLSKLIVDIMIYLNENYKKDISLDQLARSFGYEKTYLSRTFNKFMGMNLREYLNRLRVGEVIRIKRENPDTPIYKIAAECGFENQNTFYRAYHRYSIAEES